MNSRGFHQLGDLKSNEEAGKQQQPKLQPRKLIGGYNLYHSIGKGSFGEVVLAQREGDSHGSYYACKVIKFTARSPEEDR